MNNISVLKKLPLALAIAGSFAAPAFAADNTAGSTNTMDTVVVTASRTEQKLSDTLTSTSVITREDIDRIQPHDFVDLLRREAGISYTRNGGKGATSGLMLRGTNTNQVVILVDGVRINTVSNGAATLELIDLEDVDHIEIVRGPASSLYGNDAIGGVIQIFTRKGEGAPKTTVKAGYGTHAEVQTSVNTSGTVDNTHYKVGASYDNTNGINNTNRDNYSYDRDDDAYRNSTASVAVSHDFDGGHELGMTLNRNRGVAEFDRGYMDFETQTLSGKGSLQVLDNLKTALTLTNFFDKQSTPAFASHFDTHRNSALWQTDWKADEHHLLTGGAEYTEEYLNEDQGYTSSTRYNRGLFVQDQMTYGIHSVQVGVRNDDNSQYSSEDTWNAGYGLALSDSLKLFANYGTAFKAPTFNDLYFPYQNYCAAWGFICASTGNTTLAPEKSRTGEIGLKYKEGNDYWSASVYRTKVRNLIAWQQFFGPGASDSTWMPVNVNDATIEGMDLTAGTAINAWRLAAHATLLNPTDDNTGKRLLRRNKQMAGVDVDYDINEQFAVGSSWNVQGNRVDGGNHVDAGFNTVDLRASYLPVRDLKLTLSVTNVFDTDYTVAYGYETPRTGAMLTAAYTF